MKFLTKTAKGVALLLVVIPAFLFTATTPAYAATSPDLGNAASFTVLAGTAVTNVPTSVITGDVGLAPAAGSNYAGLSKTEVSGTIWAVDASGPAGAGGSNNALVTSAKTDWTTAYNGLFGGGNAACTTDYGAITKDLATLSLGPGVYCAEGAGKFELSGTLTLTGAGVWIFRSGSTLVTSGTGR